jgi:hypothetical protein
MLVKAIGSTSGSLAPAIGQVPVNESKSVERAAADASIYIQQSAPVLQSVAAVIDVHTVCCCLLTGEKRHQSL